jgi:hypothetical protein
MHSRATAALQVWKFEGIIGKEVLKTNVSVNDERCS